VTVIFEPASAVAAGICLTARLIADGRTDRHPRPCGWCDWPTDDLSRMLAGFEAWAERDEKGVPRRLEVVQFQSLPGREQAELVLAAQSFPEPEPVAVPAPDDGPEWLR
jgi:hypothetical protein